MKDERIEGLKNEIKFHKGDEVNKSPIETIAYCEGELKGYIEGKLSVLEKLKGSNLWEGIAELDEEIKELKKELEKLENEKNR